MIEIVKRKQKLIKKLNQIRIDYLYLIYKNILNKKELHKIEKQLFSMTISYVNAIPSIGQMYAVAKNILWKVEKIDNSVALFILLDRFYHQFSKTIKKIGNEYERIEKKKVLDNMIDNARHEGKVFYLCSKDKNSADDHKNWQGKIYIDEFFDRYNNKAYNIIKENNFNKLQWVIGEPIYLVMRPNCRHYFVPISNDEVYEDIDKLLKKYKLLTENELNKDIKPKNIEYKLDFYKKLYRVKGEKIILNRIKIYKKYLHNNY